MLNNLNLPDIIKDKLIECLNYSKSTHTPPNIILTNCPKKHFSKIVDELVNELNSESILVDCSTLNKNPRDLASKFTECSDNDLLGFYNVEYLPFTNKSIFEEGIISHEIECVIGSGPSAKKITIPLANFGVILSINDISNINDDFLDLFYEIIDFKKYDFEFRLLDISEFEKKYQLNIIQEVKLYLAKNFVDDKKLKIQLLEIRNKAYKNNIKIITEDFLQNTIETIPEFETINSMDGREFELFVGNLFNMLGYSNITVTQSSRDFGADVIAEKDDIKYAIQCKRYGSPVGISAVQEVIASKSLHECHVACVLTNNTFTTAARELANKNLVILWDGNKLKEFINKIQQ